MDSEDRRRRRRSEATFQRGFFGEYNGSSRAFLERDSPIEAQQKTKHLSRLDLISKRHTFLIAAKTCSIIVLFA